MGSALSLCTVIGRNVAERREQLDLTQQGLASLLRATGLEWSAVTVAKVECGSRDIKAGELVALGLALGLAPAQLLACAEPVRLGRSQALVPADAVATWVIGEQPTAHQRAQWARYQTPETAPVNLVDDRARYLAAYLSHLPPSQRPDRVSMRDIEEQMSAVARTVDQWAQARTAEGRPPTPSARRAKERHVWAALRHARSIDT